LASSRSFSTTAVPRGAASAIASMVKPLRPSERHCQLCSSPARRETTSTSVATMKAE
jgi:hypothetical protein